ncbi:glycosyltransferase family 4 protein [Polynucleobacter sp. MG-5-Ahmo-C2]|nr:glycosyltransferase family 4 protein [Polynucleobacter sp. MG-5-Ahmo-C2]
MRIAFDYQAFCMQSYGGISRYFTRLAQELQSLRQEVQVFAPLHRNAYLALTQENMVYGRYIQRYLPKATKFYLAYNFLKSSNQIEKWLPDIVHQTYYSNQVLRSKNFKTVISVYDMIHELYPNQFSVWDSTLRVKEKAIKRADHVICISENTKHDLMHFYSVPEQKISVVHLGFDHVNPEIIGKVASIHIRQPFLLYVGHRGGYKNFSGLLRAVASSPRLMKDFSILAFGGNPFSSDERALISALGFNDQQVFQYSGSDSNLQRCYQTATAFVYPSMYEGFGIPPLESMAQGCPVISSNTSSMPEVIGNAAQFFNPNSIEEMKDAIERVVYSGEVTEALKIAGRNRLSCFSWEKCAKDTLRIYYELM